MKFFECKSKEDWRNWLKENHKKENEIWLVFHKVKKGKYFLSYDFAVEEALCYGWIDSIIKKIDNEKYCRKFTVRKEKSNWSESNKKRVEKLVKEKRMKPAGQRLVDIAKETGTWNKNTLPDVSQEISKEFETELNKNTSAKKFFNSLSRTDQKYFILWINSAKRETTKTKRISESVSKLLKQEKLGLK